VQVHPISDGGAGIDLARCTERLRAHGEFTVNPYLVRGALRDERSETALEGVELTVFADGRAIVGGTTDVSRARSIYAKYVGA